MHRSALGAGALSDDWARERLPLHAGRDDFIFLVAREDGEIAGFGYGYTGAYGQWWTECVARSLTAAQRARVARPAALRDRRAACPAAVRSGAASAAPCLRSC